MDIHELIRHYGAIGVLLAMFLESSILPIPSELVIIAAGFFSIPLWVIVVAGSIGATLGGCVGYAVGFWGGRWVIQKFGRWVGLTLERMEKFEQLAGRYGASGVLIGRIIPVIPFKVFSISAGVGRVLFPSFVLMTFIGVVPRMVFLGIAGEWLRRATLPTLAVLAAVGVLIYLFLRFRKASTD